MYSYVSASPGNNRHWCSIIRMIPVMLLLFLPLSAQQSGDNPQTLSGPMHGQLPSGVYLVTGTLTIEEGTTLIVAPGTVLKFNNFTGVQVNGSLLCRGTAEKPILFTSFRADTDEGPAEGFDWNGIKIAQQAKDVVLRHVQIQYSTFGVSIENEQTAVLIEETIFKYNGYSSLSRNGILVQVWPGLSSNYNWNAQGLKKLAGKKEITDRNKVPHLKRGGRKPWVKPVRYSSAGLALIGAGLCIAGHSIAVKYNRKYWNEAVTPEQASEYKFRRNTSVIVRNTGIAVLISGGIGAGMTIFF